MAFLAIANSYSVLLHLFQASRTVSSQRMWDVLRRAVKSGSYKGENLPSESAMYWESIFSPGASSVEGQRFVSAPTSPVKSPEFAYFSGPGPPSERHDDTSEEEGVEEREESALDFPTEESEFDSSANEQESDRHKEWSQSPPIKTVQLSPAPEEYYRIVPITPYKDNGEAPEPSFSWKLPHTYSSRDRDIVQTLTQAYKEPRVVPFASVSQFEPGAPPAKKVSFSPPSVQTGSDVRERRPAQSKISKQKKVGDTKRTASKGKRKTVASKERKKMSPRKEPDGEPAEKMVSSVKGKARYLPSKFRGKSSLKGHKIAFRRKEREPSEGLSNETSEEESLVETPSRLTEDVATGSGGMNFPSISTGDYRNPLLSPLKDFYSITRSQSDPNVDVEHFRSLGESSPGSQLTRSMLEVRGDRTTDEEEQ